jgi:hypothetical protein
MFCDSMQRCAFKVLWGGKERMGRKIAAGYQMVT